MIKQFIERKNQVEHTFVRWFDNTCCDVDDLMEKNSLYGFNRYTSLIKPQLVYSW